MKKTIYCHLWIYVTFLKQNVSIVKTIKIYKKGRHFENADIRIEIDTFDVN